MQRTTHLASAALLLVAVLLTGGCGRDDGREIEILCGTSFRPPMEKLVKQFEQRTGTRALLVFGGSEDHLPKVKLKAAGDLYVTHSPYMQYTKEAGALLREVEVGFLAPALVVRKGNPQKIERIEDLARPGLGVVLPNPKYSTCGEMVDKLLQKKGIKDAVLKNVGNAMVKHHSEVGNQLKIGARDAGIMWNGVAHNFLDAVEIVPTPYEYEDEIRVAVMGLSYSKKQEAVQEFLDFVEQNGRKVFSEFGYVKSAGPQQTEGGPEKKDSARQPESVTPEPEDSAAAKPEKLLLFCGAGIRPPVAELAAEFRRRHGVTIECDYAGSEVLISRIKLTRQGDLYMPGDVYYVETAEKEGLVATKKTVCYFVPVILVQKGNPKNIRTLSDLTRSGVKVGLGDPQACAIGRKSAKIFAKNNIDEAAIDVATRTMTVNELGIPIKLKKLDAVIVWDAVAAYFADAAEVVPIPREQNIISTVAVGVLNCSEHPEWAARFVEFITSPRGKEIFKKHHYTTALAS